MAIVQVQELIEAGVHFGHRASRWNPKMRPYIYGKRNLIHIIDLRETVRGLLRAYKFLAKVASRGSLVVFVGTKRQAKEAIERESARCKMPYVNERWLGGTLTNYRTIRDRLKRLHRARSDVAARTAKRPSKRRSRRLHENDEQRNRPARSEQGARHRARSHLLQEDGFAAHPRMDQDQSQPAGHPRDESAARRHGHRRSAPRGHRRQGSPAHGRDDGGR